LAVANAAGERDDRPDPGSTGLDGLLRSLRALPPPGPGTPGAPPCCTRACAAVVEAVVGGDVGGVVAHGPDAEFAAVLAGRLAVRHLRVVADGAAGRPVPRAWRLLLDPPAAGPVRLALAGVGTLLDHDLTLAVVGACTLLGRGPGPRERAVHGGVATLLGTGLRDLVGRVGDPGERAAAALVDGAAARAAAWSRAEHLWTLRGRPAEADDARDALDREVRAAVAHLLTDRL
jgi:hypothetical protein